MPERKLNDKQGNKLNARFCKEEENKAYYEFRVNEDDICCEFCLCKTEKSFLDEVKDNFADIDEWVIEIFDIGSLEIQYKDGTRFYLSNEEHKGIFKKAGIHSAVLKLPCYEIGYNADIVDYTDDPRYPFEQYGYDHQLVIKQIKCSQHEKPQLNIPDDTQLNTKVEV